MPSPILKPVTTDDASGVEETITRYFRAFDTNDRKELEAVIADDFRFTSPYDDAIGREAFMERCWPMAEKIEKHLIERICVEDDTAFVTFLMMMADSGTQARNTIFATVRDGQVAEVHVYIGEQYEAGNFKPLEM